MLKQQTEHEKYEEKYLKITFNTKFEDMTSDKMAACFTFVCKHTNTTQLQLLL